MSIDVPTDPAIEVHEIPMAHVWLGADGIVRQRIKPGTSGALADAEQSIALVAKFGQGKMLPIMVIMGQMKSVDRGFRQYMSGPEATAAIKAVGLLTGSAVTTITGNFFLGLNKPAYPVKLFTDETEALTWLKTFLE